MGWTTASIELHVAKIQIEGADINKLSVRGG